MQELLQALVALFVVWVVVVITTVLLVRAHLRRQNRVARKVPTPAPVRWLWSPAAPARLHRRLQAAVAPIDPDAVASTLVAAPVTDDLRAEAVAHATAIDRHLAAVRRAPRRVRRTEMRVTQGHVSLVEDLCARLEGRPTASQPGPWRLVDMRRPTSVPAPWPLVDLHRRVLDLEAARAEVHRIDRCEAWYPPQPAREVDTLTSVSSATFAAPASSD